MSTINEALRGRAGVMAVAFSAAAVGLSRLHERASRRREQRRVVAELSRLSDRELLDIGLSRADLPRSMFDDAAIAGELARGR